MIPTPQDVRYTLLLFAAFSVMVVLVAVVGYFAMTPLQIDIARLKESAATIVSRKDTTNRNNLVDKRIDAVQTETSEALVRDKDQTDARIDAIDRRVDKYRDDLNARVAEINRILDAAAESTAEVHQRTHRTRRTHRR